LLNSDSDVFVFHGAPNISIGMRLSLSVLLLSCSGATGVDSADIDTDVPVPTTPDCATVDGDGDGADACVDCDDADALRFPGAVERCNGQDDDCDGAARPEEADPSSCEVCDGAGFWSGTLDLDGNALSAAIAELSADQDCNSYVEATTFMFVELDKENNEVECVYTGRKTPVFYGKPDATDMNTEHTWPQSLGADVEPAKCDLHHLYPTDSDANSRRGNAPFGLVTGFVDWQDGGSKLGAGASGVVFEPRDVHKGNVARSMLYFAHRYDHSLDPDQIALFVQWHAADPVDDTELLRSLAIGEEQVLANPFVVCPNLVDRLD
jgi:deoxyribonuclease I